MPKTNLQNYAFTFTAGGLLLDEILSLLDYLIENRVNELNDAIKKNDILKTNAMASRVRIVTEIRRRYKAVDSWVWTFLKNSNLDEQKLILFFVMLKATPIFFDFQSEVILEKWRSRDLHLDKNDVLYFFDKKTQVYPDIETRTEATRTKAATVIVRILRESGILVKNTINQPQAADYFWNYFIKHDEAWFLELALLPQHQRKELMDNYED
ncbi:MAG: DUF1819 family protein [Calditrichaeota bacterium]|nr:MAG: DUF1819 family protein [Calditrichota bacterium]MBL1207136.1 DUF1819 family protein [Calditrichota bacterium]NOG46966.1 DUF1819 family protein [Calditrichota bacterium]